MAPTPPPRSGKGSGKDAWLSFANTELELGLSDDLKLDEIRDAVDAHLETQEDDAPTTDGPNDTPPDPDAPPPDQPPAPDGSDDEPAPAPAGPREVVVRADCTVNYDGQLVRLARGQRVRGALAAFLARTGADVHVPDGDDSDEG